MVQLQILNYFQNNGSASNFEYYGFLLIPKQYKSAKNTDVTDIPDFFRVQDHAVHISKHSLFSPQDHGRLSIVRISEHSLFS